MRRLILLPFVVAGVLSATPVLAQRNPELSVEDVVRLQQLYSRYHWATDSVNAPAWADLFTSDGEFEGGSRKAKGREQLIAAAKSLGTPHPRFSLHFQTNIRFEWSPEGARGGSYMVMLAPGKRGKPPRIVTMVIYEDVLVKTEEGWRFRSRKAHSADIGLVPSLMWPPASN